MPVQRAQLYTRLFYPTNTVQISNDIEASYGSHATYFLSKEITMENLITPSSLFRYSFDMRSDTGNVVYAKIYKNGIPVGTEQSETNVAYVTKTEDIASTGWTVGDKVQLYIKNASGGGTNIYVRNFRISGDTTDWTVTKTG